MAFNEEQFKAEQQAAEKTLHEYWFMQIIKSFNSWELRNIEKIIKLSDIKSCVNAEIMRRDEEEEERLKKEAEDEIIG
jgi:hypothetical protein